MQVIARHEFETASRFPAYFSADPIFHKGVLYYPYGINPVWCRKIGLDGTMEESCHAFPKEVPLALPYQWRLFLYKYHVLLSCDRSGGVFLDLDADMKEVALAPELAQRFLCRRPTDETAEAALSGCTMRYKNSRRYQCVSPGGEVLWEEKHRGYRYTPFEERKTACSSARPEPGVGFTATGWPTAPACVRWTPRARPATVGRRSGSSAGAGRGRCCGWTPLPGL